LSPSMDIQISSNFERLLFELYGRDGAAVVDAMARFRTEGRFAVDADRMGLLREQWTGARVDDAGTTRIIAATYERTGLIVDPHTAVGLGAAAATRRDPAIPMISLATAHPAKFPDAVEAAIGVRPALPPALADLFEREERFVSLPGELDAVRDHIETTLGPV
jgi:threonine synthase